MNSGLIIFYTNSVYILDRHLTDDVYKSLSNDVQKVKKVRKRKHCELNAKELKTFSESPTTVTLLNVLGGNKHRRMQYEGLSVLIDTGCSDSFLLAKYCNATKF